MREEGGLDTDKGDQLQQFSSSSRRQTQLQVAIRYRTDKVWVGVDGKQISVKFTKNKIYGTSISSETLE